MIITIGGTAGGGKSSVASALAKKLGYNHFSAGDLYRKLAKDKSLALAELNKRAEADSSFDNLVDDKLKELGRKEDDFVVDSRLGFFFIPDSIKIFLEAKLKTRAKRTLDKQRFEECPENVKEAVKLIKEREQSDTKRYEKLYGVNPFDVNHYDLVVDTTNNSVEQTTDVVYRFLLPKLK